MSRLSTAMSKRKTKALPPTKAISELVEDVGSWNPLADAADSEISYIDIGSVNQTLKQIIPKPKILASEAPSRARQLVKSGDVLVSTVRPNLNSVAIVPHNLDGATASTGFCVLRARSTELSSRYLFHWVRSPAFISEMTRRATGQNYPAISDRIVMESLIPLPSFQEQQRIAAILDTADALHQKRSKSLNHVGQLCQSIFNKMFGDPIANPKGWLMGRLDDCIDPLRPLTYGILMPGPEMSSGVKYVRVVDMKDGEIVLSSVRATTPEIAAQYQRSSLKEGDLLMSIRGHVGRTAIVPGELVGANITQDTARIAVANATVEFIREIIQHPSIQRWMAQRTKGAAVKGINLGDVRVMPIIRPPLNLQVEFSDRYRTVRQQTSFCRRHLEMVNSIFASLQSRAFSGEL